MPIDSIDYPKYMSIDEVLNYCIDLNENNLYGHIRYLDRNYYFVLEKVFVSDIEQKINHFQKQSCEEFYPYKINIYEKLDVNTMPPIVMINQRIIDGYHRYLVSKKQGKEKILAYVNKEKPILHCEYEYG
jgi:hypothetical protein